MIKTLYFSQDFPYPPRTGYDQRVYHLIRQLSGLMSQTLVCRTRTPVARHDLDQWESFANAAVIHVPRPKTMDKLKKVVRMVHKRLPIEAAGFNFPEMETHLLHLLSEQDFDMVVVEGTLLSGYWHLFRDLPAIKVIDLHNLEYHRGWREARALPLGPRKLLRHYDAQCMKRLETRMLRESDLVWVMSNEDRTRALDLCPEASVHVAPNGVDCQTIQPLPMPDADGKSAVILFVGTLDYWPNIDGIVFFAKQVFPILQRHFPDIILRVVGRAPDPQVLALQSMGGVEIIGEVDNLNPYYQQCSACIVPLRTGGGTRLKILEAMAYGRPVVSTAIGAEGIQAQHDRHLLIADEPRDIGQAIVRLLTQRDLSRYVIKEARQLVEERYSWQGIARQMLEIYSDLSDRRRVAWSAHGIRTQCRPG